MAQNQFQLLASVLVVVSLSACRNASEPPTRICNAIAYSTQAITGSTYIMGEAEGYPEEVKRKVRVSDFNIDTHEVTNAQFAEFVHQTGYVTTAERVQEGFNVPGAAVFMPPSKTHPNWWRFVNGANWRRPEGPDSSIDGQDNYPVVQVSFEDALTYAEWANRELPTEAQWEYAAKAGSDSRYVWGDTLTQDGEEMANTWQGLFPVKNTGEDGFDHRAPVGCYPENDFGLHDMIGNVWEWTKSETNQNSGTPTYTIKGGSYLCAENYCARYRSAARQFQEADLPTNHIGFRTVSEDES